MRKYKQWTLGLSVITLAILAGWRLWVRQQDQVPAVSTLLSQAALEAERVPMKETQFDLLDRVAFEWLALGETDKARAVMDKMAVLLRSVPAPEYDRYAWQVYVLATRYLYNLGDVEGALEVARLLVGLAEQRDPAHLRSFFEALIARTSPQRALEWLEETYRPAEPSRKARRALWYAAIYPAPDFAEQQARLTPPLDVYDLLRLVEGYSLRRSPRADALLDEAVRVWQAHPEPRSAAALARALHKVGRTDEAIAVMELALQRAPHLEAYRWIELAREAHDLNCPAQVRAALRHALQDPAHVHSCNNISYAANLFRQVGLQDQARAVVSKYGSPDDHVRFLVRLGALDEAVRVAQQHSGALTDTALIDALLDGGRVQEARQVALSSGNRADMVALVARRYARQGDLQAALQMLEALPDYQYDSALLSVIEGLVQAGRLQEAERLLETASSMYASDWLPSAALSQIARGYIERKQYHEAWRIARTLDAPDARARVMLDLASALRPESPNRRSR